MQWRAGSFITERKNEARYTEGTCEGQSRNWVRELFEGSGRKKDKLIKRHFIIQHDLAIKQMQPHEKDESVFTVYKQRENIKPAFTAYKDWKRKWSQFSRSTTKQWEKEVSFYNLQLKGQRKLSHFSVCKRENEVSFLQLTKTFIYFYFYEVIFHSLQTTRKWSQLLQLTECVFYELFIVYKQRKSEVIL